MDPHGKGHLPDGVCLDLDGADGPRLEALLAQAAASHGPEPSEALFMGAAEVADSRASGAAQHAAWAEMRNQGGSVTAVTWRIMAAGVLMATGLTGPDLVAASNREWERWFNGEQLRLTSGDMAMSVAALTGWREDHKQARAIIRRELDEAR